MNPHPGNPLSEVSRWWIVGALASSLALSAVGGVLVACAWFLADTSRASSVLNGNIEGATDSLTAFSLTAAPLILGSLIPLWLGMLGAPYLVSKLKHIPFRELVGLNWKPKRDIPLGVGVGVALSVFSALSLWGVQLLGLDVAGSSNTYILAQSSVVGVAAVFLAVTLGAPLVEEIFFRGFVYKVVAAHSKRHWPAIATSAVLFGAIHAFGASSPEGALILVTLTGVVGGALALLISRVNRLGPAIVAHIIFNTIAATATLVST